MRSGIYIAVVVIVLVIRLIIKLAKNTSTPPSYKPNQPYNNPPMKQPPPYVRPSTTSSADDFLSLFDEQKPTYQQQNPFTNSPPSPPPFNNPFTEQQDAFSNIPNHSINTKSNMGAGNQSYYCMYCGKKFQSVAALKMDTCFKHPKSDQGLQKHVLYTGMGKPNIGF
jgi:hypothetical protein